MSENLSVLQGRTAVVSGAGRGLGAALAIQFADIGMRPVLCGRNHEALALVQDSIRARSGYDAPIVALDLSDMASVEQAAEQIKATALPIDLLINNGAMWLESGATPAPASEVLAAVNTAITGTFLFTERLLPLLMTSPAPDVVTIGSISGLPNAALHSAAVPFYAAKRGQTAIAEGLRQQLRGTAARSIIVHPPYLDDAMPTDDAWQASASREKGARATTRDVVDAILFAITRPRHITLDIVLDADEGGLFG